MPRNVVVSVVCVFGVGELLHSVFVMLCRLLG